MFIGLRTYTLKEIIDELNKLEKLHPNKKIKIVGFTTSNCTNMTEYSIIIQLEAIK